jgi:hypothetical protein
MAALYAERTGWGTCVTTRLNTPSSAAIAPAVILGERVCDGAITQSYFIWYVVL